MSCTGSKVLPLPFVDYVVTTLCDVTITITDMSFVIMWSCLVNRLVALILVNNMISQLPDHLRMVRSLRTLW